MLEDGLAAPCEICIVDCRGGVRTREYPVKRLTFPRWIVTCRRNKLLKTRQKSYVVTQPTREGLRSVWYTVTVTLGLLRSDRRTRVGLSYILPAIILREATSFRVSCGTQYLIYKEETRGQAIILALYSSTGSVMC